MEQHAKRAGPPAPPQPGTGIGDLERPLRRRADLMLAGQKEAFELALAQAPLAAALEVLARTLEVLAEGHLLAGALLLAEDRSGWQSVARGSIPEGLALSLDGRPLSPAPSQTSSSPRSTATDPLACAVETGQLNGHADLNDLSGEVENDEFLRDARAQGLRSIWAWPIVSASREVLGVWLLLRRVAGPLSDADLASVQEAAQAAALLIEHDRRQRHRAEEDRRQARALSALVHDLRNPLSPLRNTIELLTRMGAEPALVERATTIMSRQLGQLARLMEDLSDLSHSMPQGALPEEELPRPGPATTLPAGASAEGESGSSTSDSTEPNAYKVLVADDNELVRDAFVELLRAEGYDARTAVDGVQAVEVADQWRPQVVLLDIHMPRLSGLETARRLRAAFTPQQMTLLMMSGMSLNDAWMRHAKAAGFDDCLDKTADPKVWLARLRQAMPRH